MNHLEECSLLARKSDSKIKKCGSVIISRTGSVYGKGFNKVLDTCGDDETSVHAEEMAIIDFMKNFGKVFKPIIIFYAKIDEEGKIVPSGKPSCERCGDSSLYNGIKLFCILHKKELYGDIEDTIYLYDMRDFNRISHKFCSTTEALKILKSFYNELIRILN
jgi:hypothetical protein